MDLHAEMKIQKNKFQFLSLVSIGSIFQDSVSNTSLPTTIKSSLSFDFKRLSKYWRSFSSSPISFERSDLESRS